MMGDTLTFSPSNLKLIENQDHGHHEVSPAVEIGLTLTTGALAVFWIAYKAIRHEVVSTDHVTDQVGLALTLIASLMFLSHLSEFFGG